MKEKLLLFRTLILFQFHKFSVTYATLFAYKRHWFHTSWLHDYCYLVATVIYLSHENHHSESLFTFLQQRFGILENKTATLSKSLSTVSHPTMPTMPGSSDIQSNPVDLKKQVDAILQEMVRIFLCI